MSKKIAAGATAILLDVKVGKGAFMTDLESARKLAKLMVEIGKLVDRRTIAVLSEMDQPLGNAVGNCLELKEALDTLKGDGPDDFREHCLVICGYMLKLGGLARDEKRGKKLAEVAIQDGRSYDRFRELVKAQGGDLSYVDSPERLKKAKYIEVVGSPQTGYLSEVNAREAGETVVLLGGGRAQKGDPIDHAVGVIVHNKVGDHVVEGDPLFTVHANDQDKLDFAKQKMLAAYKFCDEQTEPLPLFYGIVG
jgi:pyrimidine-nucleoside phosphorylase